MTGTPTHTARGHTHRHHESSPVATAMDEQEQARLLPQGIELVGLPSGGDDKGSPVEGNRPAAAHDGSKFPKRQTRGVQTAFILVADIVGTGILGLPGHIAKLGWGLGPAALLLCMLANLYTGALLGRLGAAYPTAVSYGDLARQISGPRLASVVAVSVYSGLVMIVGGYMLVLGRTVQAVFFTSRLCLPFASMMAALAVWPVAQCRSFHELHGLIVVGNTTIILVVVACFAQMLVTGVVKEGVEGVNHHVALEDGTQGASMMKGMSALTGIVFAYSGQAIFLEIMSEMRQPARFNRSLTAAASFLFTIYTLISTVGFGLRGPATPSYLLDVMPYTWLRAAVNLTLFVHMVISCQIKLQVICRAAHLRLSPSTANSACLAGRLWWMLLTTALLLASWLLANAVPFFDDCVGIIGAVTSSPNSFGFPALFCLLAYSKQRAEDAAGAVSHRRPSGAAFHVARLELPLMVFFCVGSVLLTILGLGSNGLSIMHHSKQHGNGFSCHCSAKPSICPISNNAMFAPTGGG